MRQSTLLLLSIFLNIYEFSSEIKMNLRKNEVSSEISISQSNPNIIVNPYFQNKYQGWVVTPIQLLKKPYLNIENPNNYELLINNFPFFDYVDDLWVYQLIPTEVNTNYEISFLYISSYSNPILLLEIDSIEYLINDSSQSINVLYQYKNTFTATTTNTLIKFKQLNKDDSYRTAFTNVIVVKKEEEC